MNKQEFVLGYESLKIIRDYLCDINGLSNPIQKTSVSDAEQENRTRHQMDMTVLTDNWGKMKGSEKMVKFKDLGRELKK